MRTGKMPAEASAMATSAGKMPAELPAGSQRYKCAPAGSQRYGYFCRLEANATKSQRYDYLW